MSGVQLWLKCLRGIIPSAVLIFAVLGSMGGLPFMTRHRHAHRGRRHGLRRRAGAGRHPPPHDAPLVWEAMVGTMRLTAMVVFILIGSRVFSMVFQGVDGAKWVEHLLTGLPGGQVGFLIVVNIFIFFLAFFLDFFEIAFIILPMLGPVAAKLGIDLVWFGVLLCVNMQTSFMHPPFGFALFYLRGIADTLYKEKRIDRPVLSNDIYLGAIPWVLMQVLLVAIVIFVPQTVTMFLDKEVAVDLDKVKIEMPTEAESSGIAPPAVPASGAQPAASDPLAPPEDPNKAGDDEQKKMDDLFKTDKK
jgi:TRAP-type mannitol/chloroaromatic compound transport system permease large subunit